MSFGRRTFQSGSSKHAGGAGDRRCAATREIRCHVSAAARLVATASLTLLKIREGAANAEGKLQLPGGEICPHCRLMVIFYTDLIRYSSSAVASPLEHRSGYHTPASRDQEYSPAAGQDASFETSIDSLPDASALGRVRRSQTAEHHGHDSQQLSPNDMIAPASAVHSMSVNLLGTNEVSEGRHAIEMLV